MDFLGIGFPELVLIFIIAMMIFGPQRLPEIAVKIGKTVRDLRNMSQGLLTEWQREIAVAARVEELEKTRQELAELKQELQSTRQEIAGETSVGVKTLQEARREVEATTAQQLHEASSALKSEGNSNSHSDKPSPDIAPTDTGDLSAPAVSDADRPSSPPQPISPPPPSID